MPNGARHYAFTLNNYSDHDIHQLSNAAESGEVLYLIFGKEIAPTGTPHLQGHVYFNRQQSLRQAKTKLAIEAHFTVARDVQRSINYCKKDGDFTEFGTPPSIRSQSGERNDLQAFRDSVVSGVTDLPTLREMHPTVLARYPRFALSVIRDLRAPLPVVAHDLREWQSQVVEYVSDPPSPREIFFIVDSNGNAGKTYLSDYLESNFEKVQVMKPGKAADMAYEYDENTRILVIDVPRSKMSQFEYMYSFLESIKDGRLFSPKYESCTKRFPSPHVLVFMNEEPDYNALSGDRYKILVI